jgi:hypothetical protein
MKRHDSGLGQRIVRFGIPQSWLDAPPPRGTHIFARNSQWCYVSLGSKEQAYEQPDYENSEVGLPASYFIKNFDSNLLPNKEGFNSIYTFLPYLEQDRKDEVPAAPTAKKRRTTPSKKTSSEGSTYRHPENRNPSPTELNFNEPPLSSSHSNMVGKKSGRALQLEEGTSNLLNFIDCY